GAPRRGRGTRPGGAHAARGRPPRGAPAPAPRSRRAAARPVRARDAPAGRRARPPGRQRPVAARSAQSPRGVEEATRGGVMRSWLALAGAIGLAAAGCGKPAPPPEDAATAGGAAATPPDQEPPVPINADSPIQYPPRLYDQKVEGDVVLRLFVDSVGRLAPESSKVAESSGYSGLDSAALAGARKLRFAPARRHGLSIATAFLQPVEFRHPQASGAVSKGEPDTTRPRPAPVPPPLAPVRPARRDTMPPKRDTVPQRQDSARTVPDSAAKPDTNAVPR